MSISYYEFKTIWQVTHKAVSLRSDFPCGSRLIMVDRDMGRIHRPSAACRSFPLLPALEACILAPKPRLW